MENIRFHITVKGIVGSLTVSRPTYNTQSTQNTYAV